MPTGLLTLAALLIAQPSANSLGPGTHSRELTVGGVKRMYIVHVPPGYDPKKPAPVVLVLHGAAMTGGIMQWFCGLDKKADEAGFITVYPSGTGAGTLLTWNAGRFPGGLNPNRPDDVAFLGKVLDDVAEVLSVDKKQVYATGISNGAMMAYRLAVEMPDRIAAIAPVAGVMCLENPDIKQPMPILHIHGTDDPLQPFHGSKKGSNLFRFPGVEESLKEWIRVNGCAEEPTVTELPAKKDKLKVVRKDYRTGKEKAPVILYVVHGGGHTWPGSDRHARWLGETTNNIDANDLMWEFFQKFSLK
jgi:polyhydroxybutyrate depolymerase